MNSNAKRPPPGDAVPELKTEVATSDVGGGKKPRPAPTAPVAPAAGAAAGGATPAAAGTSAPGGLVVPGEKDAARSAPGVGVGSAERGQRAGDLYARLSSAISKKDANAALVKLRAVDPGKDSQLAFAQRVFVDLLETVGGKRDAAVVKRFRRSWEARAALRACGISHLETTNLTGTVYEVLVWDGMANDENFIDSFSSPGFKPQRYMTTQDTAAQALVQSSVTVPMTCVKKEENTSRDEKKDGTLSLPLLPGGVGGGNVVVRSAEENKKEGHLFKLLAVAPPTTGGTSSAKTTVADAVPKVDHVSGALMTFASRREEAAAAAAVAAAAARKGAPTTAAAAAAGEGARPFPDEDSLALLDAAAEREKSLLDDPSHVEHLAARTRRALNSLRGDFFYLRNRQARTLRTADARQTLEPFIDDLQRVMDEISKLVELAERTSVAGSRALEIHKTILNEAWSQCWEVQTTLEGWLGGGGGGGGDATVTQPEIQMAAIHIVVAINLLSCAHGLAWKETRGGAVSAREEEEDAEGEEEEEMSVATLARGGVTSAVGGGGASPPPPPPPPPPPLSSSPSAPLPAALDDAHANTGAAPAASDAPADAEKQVPSSRPSIVVLLLFLVNLVTGLVRPRLQDELGRCDIRDWLSPELAQVAVQVVARVLGVSTGLGNRPAPAHLCDRVGRIYHAEVVRGGAGGAGGLAASGEEERDAQIRRDLTQFLALVNRQVAPPLDPSASFSINKVETLPGDEAEGLSAKILAGLERWRRALNLLGKVEAPADESTPSSERLLRDAPLLQWRRAEGEAPLSAAAGGDAVAFVRKDVVEPYVGLLSAAAEAAEKKELSRVSKLLSDLRERLEGVKVSQSAEMVSLFFEFWEGAGHGASFSFFFFPFFF